MNEHRNQRVREYFSRPDNYLVFQDNIRLRAETVRTWMTGRTPGKILDIGCGDGSMSIPLLTEDNNLTLLDLSEDMLTRARNQVPVSLADRVRTIQADFLATDLPVASFDAILCMGVLAHVSDPFSVIRKIGKLACDGGYVVTQVSDWQQPVGFLRDCYCRLKSLARSPAYPLNRLTARQIQQVFAAEGMVGRRVYRYNLALPGMYRLFSPETVYQFNLALYGNAEKNRRAWLGSEYLLLFEKSPRAGNFAPD